MRSKKCKSVSNTEKKKKKSLISRLTTRSRSKVKKTETPIYHLRRGIEAKLPDHLFLEDWGNYYQSILRSGLNDMQRGMSSDEIERTYQRRFDIQWSWADSIATQVKSTFEQLTTAKENQLDELIEDIKSGKEKVAKTLKKLTEILANPTKKGLKGFDKKLLGIHSKLERLLGKQKQLERLSQATRLHICFGSTKLFNAQYHLDANGYANHEEWLEDWQKKRGGNFYSVGKGSVDGNNTMTPIHWIGEDNFTVTIKVPPFLQLDYGKEIVIPFEIKEGQRKADLLYALEANKPVTVQCFRREDKDDRWYVHLTTYVQDIPNITSKKNGCIGIDLNADCIDVIYIKPDGNPQRNCQSQILWSFPIPFGTTTQKRAEVWNIVAEIVRLAELFQCPIACENLDFTKKKASLRHSVSKAYNRMLSGFVYDSFRACLVARAEKCGVQVIFVSPAFSSVIGMIKYMPKYALSSGTAAAMVVARRALGFKERIPKEWLISLSFSNEPVDSELDGFGGRWKIISNLIREKSIPRHQLFDSTKALEVLKVPTTRESLEATSLRVGMLSKVTKKKPDSPQQAND